MMARHKKPGWILFLMLSLLVGGFLIELGDVFQGGAVTVDEKIHGINTEHVNDEGAGQVRHGMEKITTKAVFERVEKADLQNVGRSKNVPLSEIYAKSSSLRAFVYHALQRVDDGGLLLTQSSVDDCFGATLGADGVPENMLIRGAHREGAHSLVRARCDLDESERRHIMSALWVKEEALFGRDPVLSEISNFTNSRRSFLEKKTLALKLLDSPLSTASYTLIALGDSPSGYYFDGKNHDSPLEIRMLQDAWLVSRCDRGDRCDEGSIIALRLCAERGWCGASVEAALDQGYAQQKELHEQYIALQARLRAALKNKDHQKFYKS